MCLCAMAGAGQKLTSGDATGNKQGKQTGNSAAAMLPQHFLNTVLAGPRSLTGNFSASLL